jgi:DNA-binding GntR family transcriptional regulator
MNVPLHEQVRWDLLERIRRNEFPRGDPIPNEAQLCDHYKVSRITIRRAIGDLCADGVLYRRHGIGTFVVDAVSAAQSIRLRGSLADILAEDPRMRFALVQISDEAWDEAARQATAPLGPIKRLDFKVTIEKRPLAYAQLYVPAARYDEKLAAGMNGIRQPILVFVEHAKHTLAAAEQLIYAGSAAPKIAEALQLGEGTPILQMRRAYFDTVGDLISVVVGHFHPESIEIKVKLQLASMDGRKRVEGSRS